MCLNTMAAYVLVICIAALAVAVVRAHNKPAVDHKADRQVYMMSGLQHLEPPQVQSDDESDNGVITPTEDDPYASSA